MNVFDMFNRLKISDLLIEQQVDDIKLSLGSLTDDIQSIIYTYANTLKHVIDDFNGIPSKKIINLLGKITAIDLSEGNPVDNYRFKCICNGFPTVQLFLRNECIRNGSEEISTISSKNVGDFFKNKIGFKFWNNDSTYISITRFDVQMECYDKLDGRVEFETENSVIISKLSACPLHIHACMVECLAALKLEKNLHAWEDFYSMARIYNNSITQDRLWKLFEFAARKCLFSSVGIERIQRQIRAIEPRFLEIIAGKHIEELTRK